MCCAQQVNLYFLSATSREGGGKSQRKRQPTNMLRSMWTNKLGTFEALDSNPRRKRPAREVTDSYRTSFTPLHFSTASVAQKRWRNCSAGENSTNWTAWWLLSIQRWGCWNHFGSSLAFHFHYGLHMMCRTSRDLDVTNRLIKHLDHRIRLRLELYSVNWNGPWWNRAGQTVSVHFDILFSHSGIGLHSIPFTSENSYAREGHIINETYTAGMSSYLFLFRDLYFFY